MSKPTEKLEDKVIQYRLGVDVGGTFTDAILVNEATGETHTGKVPSTPRDPSIGFLNVVRRMLGKGHVEPDRVRYLVHGTTVATNAISVPCLLACRTAL